MTTLAERVSEELLPYVQQPGQYIGGEVNQLVGPRDWDEADVRVAIAFPDTYAVGMSHLGCQILYWTCNHMPGVCAERVYAPWLDAEQLMRKRNIPLFTWDTRRPVTEADIFAISLQYELVATNLLTLLDLAEIPIRAADRDERHPLVVVGGPQADNPEPFAEFVDLVVVGDGEHSMRALVEAYRELVGPRRRRRSGPQAADDRPRRSELIVELARRFPWLYAPSLYEVRYGPDGTIASLQPRLPDLPNRIDRCRTPDFEHAPFPVRPLVPHVQIIHDRISIEIMRGCPQRCRFCHAAFSKWKVNLRSPERILEIAEQAWRATGMEEIGLLSLSTADYPHLRELAARINDRFAPRMVNISVPSLRVDRMLRDVPWMVNQVRKGGLTMAVEAADDLLRAAIRKKVTDGNLLDGVRAAYRAGWRAVKLYFMCGFPGEREDHIREIYELSCRVSEARREVAGRPASVTASVSWLVPKPHTPLQWAAQPPAEHFHHARRLLHRLARSGRRTVRVKTHRVERSILEAVIARADRRLADAIEVAWRLGARMDSWDEAFRFETWLQAFEKTGIDPTWYAHRERRYDEILPWDHITAAPRHYLQRQYDDLLATLRAGQPAA